MLARSLSRRILVASVAATALLAGATLAQAGDVSVTSAQIVGGKLVVVGTTAAANARVRLDGRLSAAFNVSSDGSKKFRFSVAYVPSDCVVSVQKVSGKTATGVAEDAAVANCARGITARGQWNANADYAANDVVTSGGSSWLAQGDNSGAKPGASADWQLFALAGDNGADGAAGAGGASAGGSQGGGNTADAAALRRTPPTGPAGGDLTGTYPNPTIKANAVTSAKIVDGAVTSADIQDGGVHTDDIATAAVSAIKIKPLTVVNGKLAPNAVTTDKISDGTITGADIANSTISGGNIGISTITGSNVAASTITGSELATGSVGADELGTRVHQHTGSAVNIVDGTAHDGSYAIGTGTVACGSSEVLLSVNVRWSATAGHNERNFVSATIDRSTNPQTATVEANFDGGAGPATFVPEASCIF